MTRPNVLVVEDDAEMRHFLADELTATGFEVFGAANGKEGLAAFQRQGFDAVVADLIMPAMKGDELLARLRSLDSQIPIVIMTAFGSIESAVDMMRGGAYHYIAKPFRTEQLVEVLEAALEERQLLHDLPQEVTAQAVAAHGIVAEGPGMKRVLSLLMRAAPVDSPVLIRGENGTGKELVARAIHAAGPRRDARFVAVSCTAAPEPSLEAQLFGQRRGGIPDAREDRLGLFERAQGGTLLLDEIGDLTAGLQDRLLRVLQEGQVQPLGAPEPIPVDVRVIATTRRDLQAATARGSFRQDLLYRLNVIAIAIPPLRDRPEDLVPLAAYFLEKHGARLGHAPVTISHEALDLMRRHAWPGNTRELENVIERALVLGRGPTITPSDLPDWTRAPESAPDVEQVRSISELEREEIIRALRSVRGNKAAAARLLGFDRKTLYRKIELYGLRER